MIKIALNLIVLKVADIEVSVRFYEALGMTFKREQHGEGPVHFSGSAGSVLLELYPSKGETVAGTTRIGFSVFSLAEVVEALLKVGASLASPPRCGPWGERAVAVDPDGHRVELVQV